MKNTRSTKKQPFCWQEKKILRLLKNNYKGAELQKLRNLYLTLTEIESDFNGQNIKYYTATIAKYSGLSRGWIPKGLKLFEKLKMIMLVEEKNGGRFRGKSLVFTPEVIEETDIFAVQLKTDDGETNCGKTDISFLDTSEDNLLLEGNKREEDINNTHTGGKKEKVIEKEEYKKKKMDDTHVEIEEILKKYKELGLPDFSYRPDNNVILGASKELGVIKLFEALTLMSQSEFVKNNLSINAIFKIENLKKALNGNFKDKVKKSIGDKAKKKIEKPVYKDFTGDVIDEILSRKKGGN